MGFGGGREHASMSATGGPETVLTSLPIPRHECRAAGERATAFQRTSAESPTPPLGGRGGRITRGGWWGWCCGDGLHGFWGGPRFKGGGAPPAGGEPCPSGVV